jgi:WD40 repeat protein
MKKLLLILMLLGQTMAGQILSQVQVRTDGPFMVPGASVCLSWQRQSADQKVDVEVTFDRGASWQTLASGVQIDSMNWRVPFTSFDELQFRVHLEPERRSVHDAHNLFPKSGNLSSIQISQDGKEVVVVESGHSTCRVFKTNTRTGVTTQVWRHLTAGGTGIVQPNLQAAFIASHTNEIIRVDILTAETTRVNGRAESMCFLPGGDRLAVLGTDSMLIVHDAATLDTIAQWRIPVDYARLDVCVLEEMIYVSLGDTCLAYRVGDSTYTRLPYGLMPIGTNYTLNKGDRIIRDNRSGESVYSLKLRDKYYMNDDFIVANSSNGRFCLIRKFVGWTGSLYWVDLQSGRSILLSKQLNGSRNAFICTNDGKKLIEVSNGLSLIYQVDDNTVQKSFEVDRTIQAVAPCGDMISYVGVGFFCFDSTGRKLGHWINYMANPISFSPDGRFAITNVGGEIHAVNTRTLLNQRIPEINDRGLRAVWSFDGRRVTLANDDMVLLYDPTSRTTKKIATVEGHNDRITILQGSPLLDVIVAVESGRTAKVWKESTNRTTTVMTNGSPYTIDEAMIDLDANRVYFKAKISSDYSPSALVYTDLSTLHYARPFIYSANATLKPGHVAGIRLDSARSRVITIENLNSSQTRFSSWSSSGELFWTLNVSSESLGNIRLIAHAPQSDRFIIQYEKGCKAIDPATGTETSSGTTTWLGEILGGKAYLSMHRTKANALDVQIYICATSLNEWIPTMDTVANPKHVVFGRDVLIYATDSSWKVVRNPGADLSERATLYSQTMQRSEVSSVSVNDVELIIDSKYSTATVNAYVNIYDLMGRTLVSISSAEITSGVTVINHGVHDLPRQVAVSIEVDGHAIFRGVVHR